MECFITCVKTPEQMSFRLRQAGAFSPRMRLAARNVAHNWVLLMDS